MRYAIAILALLIVGIAHADGIEPPSVPLTPVRLVSPTPIKSVVLPPADEPHGVYLVVVRVDPTRTPTPKPMPTATRTAAPAPTNTALPIASPLPRPTALATGYPRTCYPDDTNWRGPVYPFCVDRDFGWVSQVSSVQYRAVNSNDWMVVAWGYYSQDIEWVEVRLENNTGIASCSTRNAGTGQGGFRMRVPIGGSVSFNVANLARGLYKVESYVWLKSLQKELGHGEIFICVI